jgi:hypothetical protein
MILGEKNVFSRENMGKKCCDKMSKILCKTSNILKFQKHVNRSFRRSFFYSCLFTLGFDLQSRWRLFDGFLIELFFGCSARPICPHCGHAKTIFCALLRSVTVHMLGIGFLGRLGRVKSAFDCYETGHLRS